MQRELDNRMVLGLVALVLVLIGAAAWWKFGGTGTQLSAAEAGLGKPMHPGEIPGQRQPVAPTTGNVPIRR